MNRRDFLAHTAGLSSLLLLKSCNFQNNLFFESKIKSHTKFIIGNGDEKLTQFDETYYRSSTAGATIFIGGMNDDMSYIDAPGRVHEIVKHPGAKDLYFASTKWGLEACLLDADKKTLVMDIKTNGSDTFYGHSLFSSDGQFLFASMANESQKQGFISVRETKTLNEIKRIPTGGQMPHQLRWDKENKVLAVINNLPLNNVQNKNQSILSFIDVPKGEVVKSFSTSISKQGHFSLTHDRSSAILCRSNSIGDTTLYEKLDLSNGSILTSNDYSPFTHKKIESLNHILFEDKSIVVMTITTMKRLVFWNYKENKVIHMEPFKDGPILLNITDDRKHILITFVNDQGHYYINFYHAADFQKMQFNTYKTFVGGGTGSHMTIA